MRTWQKCDIMKTMKYSYSAFGYNNNGTLCEIMTKLFPGVVFGAFHLKKNKKTLEVKKTRFWSEIDTAYSRCTTVYDFIDYLRNYTASGDQKTFEHLFPKEKYQAFSGCDLINKLKDPVELSRLIGDCRIVDDRIFKGGLFLYCARILDSKFLHKLIADTEPNIYQTLVQNYDSDTPDKDVFPCSNLFNCNTKWGNDWVCEYDYDENNDGNLKYRFEWEKGRGKNGKDWGMLSSYSVNNPYEFFIHMCQSKYTLVNIGKNMKANGLPLKTTDISKFENFSKEGFNRIGEEFNYKLNGRKLKFTDENLKVGRASHDDVPLEEFQDTKEEEYYDVLSKSILMSIEEKDGAQNMEPDFFKPKDLNEVLIRIKNLKKEAKRRLYPEKYQLSPEEYNDVFTLFTEFAILNSKGKLSRDNKVLPDIEHEFSDILIKENMYEKLNLLEKYKRFFSTAGQCKIRELRTKTFNVSSINTPIGEDDNGEEITKEDTLSSEAIMNNSGRETSNKPDIEEKLVPKIDGIIGDMKAFLNNRSIFREDKWKEFEKKIWEDFENAKSKESFYKNKILKPIKEYDSNWTDQNLKKEYLVRTYCKTNKWATKNTVFIHFFDLFQELHNKWKIK